MSSYFILLSHMTKFIPPAMVWTFIGLMIGFLITFIL
jgi:hypothetical protein